ncbi:MAG: thiol:disulfide oxidoreductase [Burkholderiales bacterium]|nr:MAG: thiol:disulfide oxidoreductase [Burkholderiales bacterium]TAG82139.1 MAG: thiol:disulfide oxidoreductase [Betaproteobacteria bacterium]
MIDLYYWTTPNGHKITMMLEEAGMKYRVIPVNIGKGAQFDPAFLKIAPNNRIPAIVDHKPMQAMPQGEALALFESGAILMYLADKSKKFLDRKNAYWRKEAIQWLFWQMGGLGPMAGQNHHFNMYAPEKLPYAINRYVNETARLYGVLDQRLADREFLAGAYSIADMACYPWIVPHERQQQNLADFPNLKRWFDAIKTRPATERAYAIAKNLNTQPSGQSDEAKRLLFGNQKK